ncbi:MAG: hypothetical protein KKB50_00040 [Planctomycetes bacterium]|nr:hypothetical protein [Planctomycetota bacterium]
MRDWLKNAFAVEPPEPASPSLAEQQLVDRLSAAIVRRHLTTPALLLGECSRPFHFVGSQLLICAAPLAEVVFCRDSYRVFARFLERRGSIAYICRRIEALARPADQVGTEADEPAR